MEMEKKEEHGEEANPEIRRQSTSLSITHRRLLIARYRE